MTLTSPPRPDAEPDLHSPPSLTFDGDSSGDDAGEPMPQNSSDRLWRIIGVLVMMGAVFACGWHLQRGVNAEPAAAAAEPERTASEEVVAVDGFDTTEGMTIGRVAVPGAERFALRADGTAEVIVPDNVRSAVGLFDAAGALRGLTLAGAGDGSPIDGSTISPRSSALTLLALMPGVASEDHRLLDQRLNALRQVEGFVDLEREILKSDALLEPDQVVEVALARVLQDLPELAEPPSACPAEAAAGAVQLGLCVVGDDGVTIENLTGRWVAVFAPSEEFRSCGAVAPFGFWSSERFAACTESFDVAAPGNMGSDLTAIEQDYLAVGAALTVLDDYLIATNNTLTGSDTRRTANRERLLSADTDVIGLQLRALVASDPGLREQALLVGDPGRAASDRLEAWTVLAQAMLDSVISRPPAGSYVSRPAAPAELGRIIALAQRSTQWLNSDATIGSWNEPTSFRHDGSDQ